MGIRVAVGQFHELTEERLRFAAQIGVSGLQMNNPTLPGDSRWEEKDVKALAKQVTDTGLKFEAIENVPTHFYHKAMMGLEGRDEQIENYQATIRAVARAGIPVLGLHFMPNSVWTTKRDAATRGGAVARQFDMSVVEANIDNLELLRTYMPTTLGRASSMPLFGKDGPVITEEQMWSNYEYFMKAVLPVAEEEGLKLALHPDDPPVPMLGGVARLFYKPDNFKKAYELVGKSDAWTLDLCLGCCSEMVGGKTNVTEMIEYFAPKGRISYIHFRDVKGSVPDFTECFIGDGNFDPAEVVVLLAKNGFDGFLLDDHVPKMDGDSDWNHRGRSHAIGYMQGLIRMAEFLQKA
ncbi:mannonate dehydratase [Devosia sp. CN2-171]|uniref:mannonate dehydratase n=1 Tax=Devosia sp. CN2-171 TaxID=3400909 RepID=UPI003BF7F36C